MEHVILGANDKQENDCEEIIWKGNGKFQYENEKCIDKSAGRMKG